jgi:hypothetical protein
MDASSANKDACRWGIGYTDDRTLDLGIGHVFKAGKRRHTPHRNDAASVKQARQNSPRDSGLFSCLEARTGIESAVRLCIVKLRQRQQYGGLGRAGFRLVRLVEKR